MVVFVAVHVVFGVVVVFVVCKVVLFRKTSFYQELWSVQLLLLQVTLYLELLLLVLLLRETNFHQELRLVLLLLKKTDINQGLKLLLEKINQGLVSGRLSIEDIERQTRRVVVEVARRVVRGW